MIEIANIRLGKACNSSSSHSLMLKKYEPGLTNDMDYWGVGGEFGWEAFTLVDGDDKGLYVALQIAGAIFLDLGNIEDTNEVLRSLFGDEVTKLVNARIGNEYDAEEFTYDGYVDHQSRWRFPLAYGAQIKNAEFMEAWAKFVLSDEVVVLGGNDNSDGHYMAEKHPTFGLPGSYWGDNLYVRRERDDWWTFYNKGTGGRITFQLSAEGLTGATEGHSEGAWSPYSHPYRSPLLVDLKVTDFCDVGCSYCYMGSTSSGQHADTGRLLEYVQQLGDMEVFELAIGGGEPTDHPDIDKIVGAAQKIGMSVGLTTRKVEQIADWENVPNAIAISVDGRGSAQQAIQDFRAIFGDNSMGSPSLVIQIVDQTVDQKTFEQIAELCFESSSYSSLIDLTLLGFKQVGRGVGYPLQLPIDIPACEEQDWWSQYGFRVDTAYVRNHPDVQKRYHPKTFSSAEGAHSMYVDGVENTVAASSYSPECIPIGKDLANMWGRLSIER